MCCPVLSTPPAGPSPRTPLICFLSWSYIHGIMQCVVFPVRLLSFCIMFLKHIHIVHLLVVCSFVELSHLPLYRCAIVCSSIFLWGIWIVSGVWQLGIKLLQTSMYSPSCGNRHYLRSKLSELTCMYDLSHLWAVPYLVECSH